MTDEIGNHLSDAGRLLRKRFDAAARRHNVTGAQWRVLLRVQRNPGMSQGQLAEVLEVEPITTCRMVDRLVQGGFVERRPNPDDRRMWNIHLTDAALPLIHTVRDIADTIVEQALDGLSPSERQTLAGLLGRVRTNLVDDLASTSTRVGHG